MGEKKSCEFGERQMTALRHHYKKDKGGGE